MIRAIPPEPSTAHRVERSVVIFVPVTLRPLVAVCIPESQARTITDGATLEPSEEAQDAQ